MYRKFNCDVKKGSNRIVQSQRVEIKAEILKPHYFKKQCFFIIIFTYLNSEYTGPKWPWSTQQAIPMYFKCMKLAC